MKKLLSTLFIVSSLFVGVTVAHSTPKSETTQPNFYNFEDQLIDGIIPKPTAMGFNARGKVRFGRLSHLSKCFMGSLFATSRDATFK